MTLTRTTSASNFYPYTTFCRLPLFSPPGLDEAILGGSGSTDPEGDTERIAQLLAHGAHGLAAAEANQQGDAFQAEDIDQVGVLGQVYGIRVSCDSCSSLWVAAAAANRQGLLSSC